MKGMTREESHRMWEEMKKYKADNHSMGEVAERFGVTKGYAQMICKGICPQTDRRPTHYRNQYTRTEPGQSAMKHIEACGFEYVDGYTNCDGFVNIRCKTCGSILRKSMVGIRHGKMTVCDVCERNAAEEREKLKAEERERRDEEKRKARTIIKYEQISFIPRKCKCCGQVFIDAKQATSRGANRVYCSMQCARRINNKKGKDKRLRKIRSSVIDKDITIEKLYERDNGKCYLCGCTCDWNDREIRGDAFIAGDKYPSIDHVVPLSKGGLHAWDNVRLACRKCNYEKRDSVILPVAQ